MEGFHEGEDITETTPHTLNLFIFIKKQMP